MMLNAPTLFIKSGETGEAGIDAVVEALERGFNERDADLTDSVLGKDVLWGSPKGQLVTGLEELHIIHQRLKKDNGNSLGYRSRYTVEALEFLTEDIACAHVRRTGLDEDGAAIDPAKVGDQIMQELALYVLVKRNDRWWIAAGQNTPARQFFTDPQDRGGSTAAS